MLRLIVIVAIIGQALAVKITLSTLRSGIYRDPLFTEQESIADVELEYIEQRLDNFDQTNDATWQMVSTSQFASQLKERCVKKRFVIHSTNSIWH